MRTEQEILAEMDKLIEEMQNVGEGEEWDTCNGWLRALKWVLNKD